MNAYDALELTPQQCAALENSLVGLLAAKSARIKTIIILEASVGDRKGFVIAVRQLDSLQELTRDFLRAL